MRVFIILSCITTLAVGIPLGTHQLRRLHHVIRRPVHLSHPLKTTGQEHLKNELLHLKNELDFIKEELNDIVEKPEEKPTQSSHVDVGSARKNEEIKEESALLENKIPKAKDESANPKDVQSSLKHKPRPIKNEASHVSKDVPIHTEKEKILHAEEESQKVDDSTFLKDKISQEKDESTNPNDVQTNLNEEMTHLLDEFAHLKDELVNIRSKPVPKSEIIEQNSEPSHKEGSHEKDESGLNEEKPTNENKEPVTEKVEIPTVKDEKDGPEYEQISEPQETSHEIYVSGHKKEDPLDVKNKPKILPKRVSKNKDRIDPQNSGPSKLVLQKLPALLHEEVHDQYGQYALRFITAEDTVVSERGRLVPGPNGEYVIEIEGKYQFIGDDGQIYVTEYKAGRNGFQVLGEHLPLSVSMPAI